MDINSSLDDVFDSPTGVDWVVTPSDTFSGGDVIADRVLDCLAAAAAFRFLLFSLLGCSQKRTRVQISFFST